MIFLIATLKYYLISDVLKLLHIGMQKQPPEVFYKKVVLKNSAKFTGKHLCQQPATLLKKKTLAQGFSYEFCEIFKDSFFIEHLRATASKYVKCSMNAFFHISVMLNLLARCLSKLL